MSERYSLGIALTIVGGILIGVALITGVLYVEYTNPWIGQIGRFGTSVLYTGGFITIPFGIYAVSKGIRCLKE